MADVGRGFGGGMGLVFGGCAAIILIIVMLIAFASNLGAARSKKQSSTTAATSATTKSADTASAPAGKVDVKSSTLQKADSIGYRSLVGEVVNNTGSQVSSLTKVSVTLYDKDGNVTGTDYTYLDDAVEAGATSSFSIHLSPTELTNYDHYKLAVNWN